MNHAADSRGALPPRGCIRKINRSCEKTSLAAEEEISMGEKAEVKRETNDVRRAESAREAAAALAATLNCAVDQEHGNRGSNNSMVPAVAVSPENVKA